MENSLLNTVMTQLQVLGTEKNCKIYQCHGGREPVFGVSFANLNQFKKQIKINHDLAKALWDTQNLDAMTLATMIADPKQATDTILEQWSKELYCYALADLSATYVSKTGLALLKIKRWTAPSNEWIARAGWIVLAKMAMENQELTNDYFQDYLQLIKRNIHNSKNFTKPAINNALIAIGMRNSELEKQALTIYW